MTTRTAHKYRIGGVEISEVPNAFVYFHRDTIQPQTLWLATRRRNTQGAKVIGYHLTERYLKTLLSDGTLPDTSFRHIGRIVTIT